MADLPHNSEFPERAVWGGQPGAIQLRAPKGLTLDADGCVYSTDFQAGLLRRFSPNGVLDIEVGDTGTEPGLLANPIGVAGAGHGTIFVSESRP